MAADGGKRVPQGKVRDAAERVLKASSEPLRLRDIEDTVRAELGRSGLKPGKTSVRAYLQTFVKNGLAERKKRGLYVWKR